MSQYKVGDVAALFGKPKEATTEAGKKLQSLFEDFHCKKKKSGFQSRKSATLNQSFENGDNEDHSNTKKSKKRKFSELDSTLCVENNVNEISDGQAEKISKKKFKNNDSNIEQDFPRKKKKKFASSESSASKLQPEDIGPKDVKVNSGLIKKSKHKKNKNDSVNFEFKVNLNLNLGEAFSKNASVRNNEEIYEDDDQSFKKEKAIKQSSGFIKKSKLKKNKKDSVSFDEDYSKTASVKNNEEIYEDDDQSFKKETAIKPSSGFIKKSKNKKNKNDSVSFDEANSKNTSGRNNEKASEDDDELFKEEIKKFLEDNSESKKPKKKKKPDSNQVSAKKSSDVMKIHGAKSRSNENFKDASLSENFSTTQEQASKTDSDSQMSPIKRNQTADFVRKPKNKNKEKNTSRYYDVNDTMNGVDALFKSEHEENEISHKRSASKFGGIQSPKQISYQDTSGKTELDFIPIPDTDSTPKSESKIDDKERLKRTVFVGNLPLNVNKKALRLLLSPFGEIESIRTLRIETDKAKIYSKNPPKTLNRNYASESVPAFVVFVERQSAIDALSLTGTVFKDRHITVDIAMTKGTKKLYDEKRSIFIGNLPFGVKDESIWNAFSECGRIEGVRIVRDRETGLAKGFGYVVFSTMQSKENALGLKDLTIEGRSIRIKAVESNKEKQKAKGTSTASDTFKSHAIRFKKNNKNLNSRKSVSKLIKKEKTKHNKRKTAAILQKAMK